MYCSFYNNPSFYASFRLFREFFHNNFRKPISNAVCSYPRLPSMIPVCLPAASCTACFSLLPDTPGKPADGSLSPPAGYDCLHRYRLEQPVLIQSGFCLISFLSQQPASVPPAVPYPPASEPWTSGHWLRHFSGRL